MCYSYVCLNSSKNIFKEICVFRAYLVPLYCFGENDVYYQIPNLRGSIVRRIQVCAIPDVHYGKHLTDIKFVNFI